MRFLLKLINSILTIYVFVASFILIVILIQTKILKETYPSLFGYTYLELENNYLEPELKQNEFIIIGPKNMIKENDYVYAKENDDMVFKKIIVFDEDDVTLNYNSVNMESKVKHYAIEGKMIYHNKNITPLVNILFNPIVIIISIIITIIISNKTYKRYQ